MDREKSLTIITVVLFYRASDFLIQKMSRTFCLEVGFSKLEIANIVQFFGTLSMIIGGFAGGYCVKIMGIRRSMLYFGLVHMQFLLLYLVLYFLGHNTNALGCVIFFEGMTEGAVAALFLAFLYDICETGSQYAIVWAIHEIGGMFFRSISGILVDIVGWPLFFTLLPLASAPSLIALRRKVIKNIQPVNRPYTSL
jgi:PAT family beta-lactamase induction signal transducer AmpG